MTVDHIPRRSYSHNNIDSSSHKRGAQSLGLLPDNRHQAHQQNKRHHAEIEVDKFTAGMAENIKQIIANSHQNVHKQPNPSPKRTRPHNAKGVSNFHLDQNDQIIRTYAGHPRCNYCFVASHPRIRCKFRKQDLLNGIDRASHPEKGLLSYKDSKNTYTPKPPVATIEQLPNEILEIICEYLTFEERCKFGATNGRIQFILTADKFWHKILIPNHLLKYELINEVVNIGTQSLSIPWSSINGEWTEYSHLVSTLHAYTSNLVYLNISGFNESTQIRGDNRMITILIAKSADFRTLDLTASKLTLLSTIATIIPYGHRLASLNLSMVGSSNHHNFLLRYATIERIVDKLKCLKNIILAGKNLCRKSIMKGSTWLQNEYVIEISGP